jgi:hypothetical protein
MSENVEFTEDMDNEGIEFDSDDELEDALDERAYESSSEWLKERGRAAWTSAAERGRRRIIEEGNRRKARVADVLEGTASRLDERLTYGAEYLRNTDVEMMRDDLVAQVRKRPLLSVGIAVGAGFLVGKAMNVASGGSGRGPTGRIGKQIRRALISTATAMIASRLRDAVGQFEFEPEPEPEPVRKRGRPRKNAR